MSYETIDPSKAQLAFQIQDRSVNEFHVVRYTGTEGFCQLFRFEIDLSSNVGTAKLEELVGEAAVLSINTPWGARWFHGIIGRFQLTGDSGDHTYYRAELVPSLWRLTHRYKSRIFQLEGKSTKDIVLKVLQDGGVPSDRVDAGNFKGTRKKRPYCVQYRETDYQFICRLLEDEGARWYFEHDQDGHTLVLCDETSAYQPIDGEPGKLPYQPPSGMYAEEEHVTHFKIAHSMRPDAVVLTDYDFEHPDLALKAESSKGTKKQHVFADSPGQFKTADLGGKLAQLRIDELNAGSTAAAGQSNSPRLTVGHTFEISNHPTEDANKTYLLTSLTHNGTQGSVGPTDASTTKAYGADLSVIRRAAQWLYNGGHVSTDAAAAANLFGENPLNAITAPDLLGTNGSQPENGAGAALYACRFECIPATAAYRPPRVTPWPKIAGAQTARVVGPDKETIHTDKYGRVKVQFHWDREGNEAGKPKQHGADSSCWIRVSQGMAGGNYGMMFLPRVGQEVIVEFIEGNPDEPIITGRVYNFDHMPPYELPANATRSTIKTSSVPDAKGTNEICFEDMAGKEYLLIHAQKDLHVRVKEKRIETVVKDRQLTVEGNKHEHVKQAKHVEVGLDLFEKVGGKKELKVAGDVAEDFGANHTEVTKGDVHLESKNGMLYLKASKAIVLEAGGNYLKIDSAGIVVEGKMVDLNCGKPKGAPASQAAVAGKLEAPGAALETVDGRNVRYTGDGKLETADPIKAIKGHEVKQTWIEVELIDEVGRPVVGEPVAVVDSEGNLLAQRLTGDDGVCRVLVDDPGTCQLSFPNLDKDAWKSKEEWEASK